MPEGPTIEQLEDELRQSQFKAWDAEEFLARRHQAKIEAVEPERFDWRAYFARIGRALFTAAGWIAICTVALILLLSA